MIVLPIVFFYIAGKRWYANVVHMLVAHKLEWYLYENIKIKRHLCNFAPSLIGYEI